MTEKSTVVLNREEILKKLQEACNGLRSTAEAPNYAGLPQIMSLMAGCLNSRDVALAYGALGFKVYPCNGKAADGDWRQAAADEAEIRKLWGRRTKLTVALPMTLNGLYAVDVDQQKPEDINPDTGEVLKESGFTWLKAYEQEHGELDTLTVETPSGGRHYIFLKPEGIELQNSANKVADHVDTRSDGYIVAAGSVRDGVAYHVIKAEAPAAIPDALLAVLPRKGEAKKAAPLPMADSSTSAQPQSVGNAPARPQHEPISNSDDLNVDLNIELPSDDELLENLNRRLAKWAQDSLKANCETIRQETEGSRNDTLNNRAFRSYQLAHILTEETVTEALFMAGTECGLPQEEVRKTLNSAKDDGMAQPRYFKGYEEERQAILNGDRQTARTYSPTGRKNEVFQPKVKTAAAEPAQPKAWEEVVELEGANKVPSLDLACLPDLLATYVPALAKATQVPLDFAFAMVLPCIATAVQGRYAVQIHKGFIRPLCLYIMSPLGSGDRKSTTIDICKRPLTDIESARQDKAAKDSKEIETTIDLMRLDLGELVRNYGKAVGEERDRIAEKIRELKDSFPEQPTTPFLFTENATIESLGVLMTENKERMSIITGEAEFLNNLDGMYNGGKATGLDLVLESWGGGRVSIHRITRDAVLLKSPLLTLGFGAQPLFFTDRKNKSVFRARGVDGRFLYVMPKSFQGARDVRMSPHLPDEVEAPYVRMIKLLMDEHRETESNKFATPLVLTEEAEEEMYQFAEAIEAKLGKGGELEEMRDWGNRIVDNVGRIAALFHCVEHPEAPAQEYIALETVLKAATLGYYFIEHAKAAYGLMDDDELIAKAKKVLEWIQRQAAADVSWKQFSVRECHTALRKKKEFAHVSEIKTALQELEERHYIRQAPLDKSKPRPTVIYEVNPSILTHKG